jgi:hypothetical protein
LKSAINTNEVLLFTENGTEVLLNNRIKDTSCQSNDNSKGWYATFRLNADDINSLKQSKVTYVQVLVGKKSRKLPVSALASNEIQNLFVSKF